MPQTWQCTFKLQYNTGVAMQDNAVQYTSGTVPTILAANTISNTGNIAKMVYPDFFGGDGDRNPHHSDKGN